jgi:hypothetical protein
MVSAEAISFIAFGCIFGGTLIGMVLRSILPEHHLSEESRDVVKLGAGMIATLAALVLGLMIASAKGNFDTMSAELKQAGSRIILLDRTLAQYGPETGEARVSLRNMVMSVIEVVWGGKKAVSTEEVFVPGAGIEAIQKKLRALKPSDEMQRSLQSRALQLSNDIAEGRWLMEEQWKQRSLPTPFLVILICWLTIIFTSFGLLAPRNGTVAIVLLVCALSASGSLFLIEELDHPYEGFIKISGAPLTTTLKYLGR